MKNLILLHGALGSKSQFESLSARLSQSFAVHRLNFPGHGGEAPDDFSIAGFSKSVLKFMDENQIDSAFVFGYSLGGYVALHLAVENPARIAGVFTLATKLEWSPLIAERETRMLDPKKMLEKVPAFAEELRRRHSPGDWVSLTEQTAELMRNLGDSPAIDFSKVQCKVRYGVGDRDAMVSIGETHNAFLLTAGSSLVVFPGTFHPIEKVSESRLEYELNNFFSSI